LSSKQIDDAEGKDWLTTLLLCFFLGVFGVHRFYTGSTGLGVAQLLTGGGCGIWALIDFIMILTGGYKDGNGNPLVRRN
jgi:TM2 domain-containing membrane protein YozV